MKIKIIYTLSTLEKTIEVPNKPEIVECQTWEQCLKEISENITDMELSIASLAEINVTGIRLESCE